MTAHQKRHFDRKCMENVKRDLQYSRRFREIGLIRRLDPNRLPK